MFLNNFPLFETAWYEQKSWFIPLEGSPKYFLFHLDMTFTDYCIACGLVMLDFLPTLSGCVDACRNLYYNWI